MMKIGILDWGIGGLGFYQEFKKRYVNTPVIYVSDSGFTPYGKVKEKKLRDRVSRLIDWLQKNQCDQIMVACNAASTVLVNDEFPFVSNIIDAGIKAIKKNSDKNVAVIGGRRTVDSHIYKSILTDHNINEVVGQPLSALIEKGDIVSEELKTEITLVLSQVPERSVLLACTHYPAAIKLFNLVDENKVYLDPVQEAVNSLPLFKNDGLDYEDRFYTTGNTSHMQAAAVSTFGVNIPEVINFDIQ